MSIASLELSCLRNLSRVRLEAHPQLNIIAGPNGSGKTSLLEAIYLLGRGRSFRTTKRSSFIQDDRVCCNIFARFHGQHHSARQLGIEICQDKRRIRLDGQDINRSADLAKILPIQFFNQQSFSLVDQGPSVRRKFLDWGVFHVEPAFFPAWQHYQKALQQRNAALRQHSRDLKAWNKECTESAENLTAMRRQYVAMLEQAFQARIRAMLPGFQVTMHFYPGWDEARPLEQVLIEDTRRDLRRGFTHNGPHRADLVFQHNAQPVVEHLSRGQQKLFVSALILAQADIYASLADTPCVILVDDLTAELDRTHSRAMLESLLHTGAQVFVTVTDASLLGELTGLSHSLFHVKQGDVEAEKVV